MTDRMTLQHVTRWLSDLAKLTAGAQPMVDAKSKLTAYAVSLAEQLPAAAFNPHSLEFVASQCRFFPSYGEVKVPLTTWWREHRPAPRQIAAPAPVPERTPPTEEERAAVAAQLAALVAELTGRQRIADAAERDREPRRAAPPLTPRMLAAAYAQAGAVNPRPPVEDEHRVAEPQRGDTA